MQVQRLRYVTVLFSKNELLQKMYFLLCFLLDYSHCYHSYNENNMR